MQPTCEILPNLYIGNIETSRNLDFFNAHKILNVVNTSIELFPEFESLGINYSNLA
jgi:hypothetical protein